MRHYSKVFAVCRIEIPLLLKENCFLWRKCQKHLNVFVFLSTLFFLSMPVENCIAVSYSEYWFSGLQRLRKRSRVITLLEGIKNIKCDEKGSV